MRTELTSKKSDTIGRHDASISWFPMHAPVRDDQGEALQNQIDDYAMQLGVRFALCRVQRFGRDFQLQVV